jgi:CheY-like chemotaxis protein
VKDSARLWLAVENGADEFYLLQRVCLSFSPQPKLYWARDGIEARDYLAGAGPFGDRHRFPLPILILSDIKMPRFDGFELLEWVKLQPHLSKIPFVILTSSNLQADVARADEFGADQYLVKPVDFGAFVVVLNEVQDFLK